MSSGETHTGTSSTSTSRSHDPLSGRAVAVAVLAPLAAYGITICVAVAMSVLLVISLAVGSGSPGDDLAVEQSDVNGIGILVGFPFQLTAMGLFGTLHTGTTGLHVHVFALPLLLTAVFAGAVFALVRRFARHGTRDRREALLLSGIGGLSCAAAVNLVSWIFSMREAGISVNAASPTLFVGTFVIAAVSGLLARGPWSLGRRSPLSRDWISAGRLAVFGLLLWVCVATVLLMLVAWVKAGFAWALAFPLWAPSAALLSYGLGHLAGYGVGGGVGGLGTSNTVAPWDALGKAGFLVALLAALGLAVLTALIWQRRRDGSGQRLASAASWAVLPATSTAVGLMLLLVTSVNVEGDLLIASGQVSARLTWWSVPVLAAWGAAVEVASRAIDPRLVQGSASSLLARIAERAVPEPGRAAASKAPTDPTPLSPTARRRLRLGAAAAAGIVAVVVVAAVAVSWLNGHRFGPEQQARAYLDDVAGAKLDRATALAPLGGGVADDLVTGDVYSAAENRVTGYRVRKVTTHGDRAEVEVDLRGLVSPSTAVVHLTRDGSQNVLFHRWRITQGGLARELDISLPEGASAIGVNGVEVNAESADLGGAASFWALPGTYAVDPYAGSRWIQADTQQVEVTADLDEPAYTDLPDIGPSEEMQSTVNARLDAYLDRCMKATALEPDGCPENAFDYGYGSRSVSWTLVTRPTLDFGSWDGTFPATFYTAEAGEARVNYQSNMSWTGAAQWERMSATSGLDLTAEVDVNGEDLEVTFDSY